MYKEIEEDINTRFTSSSFYKYTINKNFVYYQKFSANFEALNEADHTYVGLIYSEKLHLLYKTLMLYNEYTFQLHIVPSFTCQV